MNVYLVQADSSYRALIPVDLERSDPIMQWRADTEPAAYEKWRPATFRDGNQADEGFEGDRPLGDFAGLGAGAAFALLDKAMLEVGVVLGRHGVLLPLVYRGANVPLHWFHCTTQIDALDERRTIGRRMDSGFYAGIDRLAFHAAALRDAMVFRVPQRGAGLGCAFCTNTFKHLVDDRGLKGLDFLLTWSDEPEGMARIMAREKANGLKLPPMQAA